MPLEVRSNNLDPGPVGRRSLPFVATSPEDLRAALLRDEGKLLGYAGLADAGLTCEQYETTVPGIGPFESRRKPADHVFTPYQREIV